MNSTQAVGKYGEELAEKHVVSLGWEVLGRNWRGRSGELDLVAMSDGDVIVIEVKTRRGDAMGHPASAVTPAKLARLRRLAGEWLSTHEVSCAGVRIDVIAVVIPRAGPAVVEHLRGVT